MGIDLTDEREYAWLLVRSDTLTGEIIKLWQWIPIRAGSMVSAVIGYPLRFVTLLLTGLISGLIALAIVIGVAQLPVTIFAYLHPFLADWIWLSLLGALGITFGGYLVYAIGVWAQAAAREDGRPEGMLSAPISGVEAAPVDPSKGWNRWQSLHVSHESARNGLFAGLSIAMGVAVQCAAVVLGSRYFEGPIDTGWQWPFMFGEQLVNTMLLGIPTPFLPTFAEIRPVAPWGQILMISVDLFYVAGVIAMATHLLPSMFKVRELFNGTTRDLADHLENFDISGGDKLMIHRVAVLRPLDETEVVSLSKETFFETVKDADGVRGGDPL